MNRRCSIVFLFIFYLFPLLSFGQNELSLIAIDPYIASNPDTAFYLAKSVSIRAGKKEDVLLKAQCALKLGEIQFYLGNFELADLYLQEAIEVFDDIDQEEDLAKAYTWKGIISQYSKRYAASLPFYQKALYLYERRNDSLKMGELLGWIGHYFEKTGNTDTALILQFRAIHLLSGENGSPQSMAKIYDNIGSIYEDKENYDSARFYFSKALLINHQYNEINGQIVNINNIGDTYRKKGLFDEALLFTDSAFRLATSHHLVYQIRSAHRDFSKIYALKNDPGKSLFHLEKAYTLYTQLLNEEQLRRMTLLQMAYETERKENQIVLLEKDKRFNRYLRYILFFGLFGFMAGGFIVFGNQKTKVKQSRKILDQKTRLYEKDKEVTQLQIRNSLLNEEKLQKEIENRKKQELELQENILLKSQLITSHTLQIIRKNNFLEKLKTDLPQLKKLEKKERYQLIQDLVELINHDITKDENWDDFNIIFGKVHRDFYNKLKSHAPDISPNEMRLSALIKLNLHSQEIATILGISIDSLRIARYRLKKKLQLVKNDDLATFLINI